MGKIHIPLSFDMKPKREGAKVEPTYADAICNPIRAGEASTPYNLGV